VQASVTSNRSGSVVTVAVSGDIDISASGAVEAAVIGAVAGDGLTRVEVDLSGVEFLDSSGVSLLLRGRRKADEQGVEFRVTGARGVPKRVLEMTGVWAHLCGEPDPT
jgi:anti-sigma B factor antagonist